MLKASIVSFGLALLFQLQNNTNCDDSLPTEPPKINSFLHVTCQKKFIQIRAVFDGPFYGVVHTRPNRSGCTASGTGERYVTIFVPLAEPGLTDCGVAILDGWFTVVVDVNWHSVVESVFDNSFLVSCAKKYTGSKYRIQLPDSANMLLTRNGGLPHQIVVGSNYEVELGIDRELQHKITNCIAFGGDSTMIQFVPLIDSEGCPVNSLMTSFSFSSLAEKSKLSAQLTMFRFNNSNRFHLQCLLNPFDDEEGISTFGQQMEHCSEKSANQYDNSLPLNQNLLKPKNLNQILTGTRVMVNDVPSAANTIATLECSLKEDASLMSMVFVVAVLLLLLIASCSYAVYSCPFKIRLVEREERGNSVTLVKVVEEFASGPDSSSDIGLLPNPNRVANRRAALKDYLSNVAGLKPQGQGSSPKVTDTVLGNVNCTAEETQSVESLNGFSTFDSTIKTNNQVGTNEQQSPKSDIPSESSAVFFDLPQTIESSGDDSKPPLPPPRVTSLVGSVNPEPAINNGNFSWLETCRSQSTTELTIQGMLLKSPSSTTGTLSGDQHDCMNEGANDSIWHIGANLENAVLPALSSPKTLRRLKRRKSTLRKSRQRLEEKEIAAAAVTSLEDAHLPATLASPHDSCQGLFKYSDTGNQESNYNDGISSRIPPPPSQVQASPIRMFTASRLAMSSSHVPSVNRDMWCTDARIQPEETLDPSLDCADKGNSSGGSLSRRFSEGTHESETSASGLTTAATYAGSLPGPQSDAEGKSGNASDNGSVSEIYTRKRQQKKQCNLKVAVDCSEPIPTVTVFNDAQSDDSAGFPRPPSFLENLSNQSKRSDRSSTTLDAPPRPPTGDSKKAAKNEIVLLRDAAATSKETSSELPLITISEQDYNEFFATTPSMSNSSTIRSQLGAATAMPPPSESSTLDRQQSATVRTMRSRPYFTTSASGSSPLIGQKLSGIGGHKQQATLDQILAGLVATIRESKRMIRKENSTFDTQAKQSSL